MNIIHLKNTLFYILVLIAFPIGVVGQLSVTPVAAVFDNADGYTALDGATSVTTTSIGDKTYALVAAVSDSGVQIIDITDPTAPQAVAAVFDNADGYTALNGAASVTTTSIGDKIYALVAAQRDDGVQIIDITDPTTPQAVVAVFDNVDGYTALDNATFVTTTSIGDKTYALVAAFTDDGVQFMEFMESTASIGELLAQSVSIYPNPVHTHLHLAYPTATHAAYRVYDLTGKTLSTHHASGQKYQLNISGLSNGVYLLEAKHGNQKGVFRFVKE